MAGEPAAAPPLAVPAVAVAALDGTGRSWAAQALDVPALAARGRTPPAAGFAAGLRLAWDARGLLLAVTVRDAQVIESPDLDGIPAHDGIEVVVADGREPMNAVQLLISPGASDAQPQPRLRIVDRRIRQFHDPRRQRALLARLPTAQAEVRSRRLIDGYAVELRLPWAVLAIPAAAGSELIAQVSVTDRIAAGGPTVTAAWYGHGWASSDPRCGHRLRLAGRAAAADAKPVAAADDARFHVEPCTGEPASLFAWLPERRPLRAIWLTLPGTGFATTLTDRAWSGHPSQLPVGVLRAFAEEEGLALIGASYAWVERTGALAAMARLGARTGHPELATLPLIVDGFSAGGKWTYHRWLGEMPERLVAVGVFGYLTGEALVKDGRTWPFVLGDAACRVPAVFHVGAADSAGFMAGPPAARAALREHRPRGAPWLVAVAPRLAHVTGAMQLLSLPFYRDVLALRLGPDGALRDLDLAKGWLGDPVDASIAPAASFAGDPAAACWFPSRYTAEAWRLLVTVRDLDLTVDHLKALAELGSAPAAAPAVP